MNFNEYQKAALDTATYPNKGNNLLYPALGLAGEAGEFVDKIKKLWRNKGITKGFEVSPEDQLELLKELGDVQWYLAALAFELYTELEEVADINIAKLLDRRARGVVNSEGDNR